MQISSYQKIKCVPIYDCRLIISSEETKEKSLVVLKLFNMNHCPYPLMQALVSRFHIYALLYHISAPVFKCKSRVAAQQYIVMVYFTAGQAGSNPSGIQGDFLRHCVSLLVA